MLIDPHKASLLVIDVQAKLLPAIADGQGLLARLQWLLGAVVALEVPVVISEQYPQGLGPTEPSLLALAPQAQVVEKKHFSCVAAGCLPADLLAREQILVCGIEAHVCVLQTVLELRALGKTVFVVADAIGSRAPASRELALARMQAAGAVVVNREMVLFELMGSAEHPQFRTLSKRFLVGEQP